MLRRRVLPLRGAAPSHARQLSLHPVCLAVEASHAHASIRDRLGRGSSRFVRSEGATQEGPSRSKPRNGSETNDDEPLASDGKGPAGNRVVSKAARNLWRIGEVRWLRICAGSSSETDDDDDASDLEDREPNEGYSYDNIKSTAELVSRTVVVTYEDARAYPAASAVNPESQRGHDRMKIVAVARKLGIDGRFVGFYRIPNKFSAVSLSSSNYASGSNIYSRLVATVYTRGRSYGGNGEAMGTRPQADGGMLLHCAAQVHGGPQDKGLVYVAVADLPEGTEISRRTTDVELGGGARVVIFDDAKCDLGSCLSPTQLNLLFSAVDKTTSTGNDDRRRITSVSLYDDHGIPTPSPPNPPTPHLSRSIYLSTYLRIYLLASIQLLHQSIYLRS